MAVSRPFKEDRPALPLSTPLSSRRSMVRCPWLCARRQCLNFLNKSALPRRKPHVVFAFSASLSARSFPFIPACPGQYTHRIFQRWMSTDHYLHMLYSHEHTTYNTHKRLTCHLAVLPSHFTFACWLRETYTALKQDQTNRIYICSLKLYTFHY